MKIEKEIDKTVQDAQCKAIRGIRFGFCKRCKNPIDTRAGMAAESIYVDGDGYVNHNFCPEAPEEDETQVLKNTEKLYDTREQLTRRAGEAPLSGRKRYE